MKPMYNLLKSLVLIGAAAVAGCSSAPDKMYFSPEPFTNTQTIYRGEHYTIRVADNRRAKHLLEIIDADGKKLRRPAGNAIGEKLVKSLQRGFSNQGLAVSSHAPDVISLEILQLETVVAQRNLSYEASFAVEFKVVVNRQGKTFFKTFTGHTSREGVLRFDMASMEQELNSLVAQVLGDIFNDSYIQQSIKA